MFKISFKFMLLTMTCPSIKKFKRNYKNVKKYQISNFKKVEKIFIISIN